MKRKLIFQAIKTHEKLLGNGTSYSFFDESDQDNKSVTTFIEDNIVDWIFKDKFRTELFMNNLYSSNYGQLHYGFRIKEPLLTKEDQKIIGDIDMIICPVNHPNYTTVIEFKRIKVSTENDQSDKVTKYKRCRVDGLKQTDKLRSFNYWKTYLGIIIQDDARKAKTANTLVRSTTGELERAIYDITFDKDIDEHCGVIYIRIVQPTGDAIDTRNSFEICLDKLAKPMQQSHETTRRLEYLIAEQS